MSKRNLYLGQPGATSAAVYTSGNTYTSIFAATVCNPTGGAVTLDVWLVATGGSVADASKLYDAVSIGAGETKGLQALINLTMDKDSEIHMQASAATSLTVSLSGDQHS